MLKTFFCYLNHCTKSSATAKNDDCDTLVFCFRDYMFCVELITALYYKSSYRQVKNSHQSVI